MLIAQLDTSKYKYRPYPSSVLDSNEGLEMYSLSLVNAYSHSSIKSRHLLFFIVAKSGLHLSMDRERNLLRAVACLSSFVFLLWF